MHDVGYVHENDPPVLLLSLASEFRPHLQGVRRIALYKSKSGCDGGSDTRRDLQKGYLSGWLPFRIAHLLANLYA